MHRVRPYWPALSPLSHRLHLKRLEAFLAAKEKPPLADRKDWMAAASGWISIDIKSLRNATRDIDFDVFIQLSPDNFAHVFSRTTGLDYKRLAQYIQKGVKELHIKAEDEVAFKRFISKPATEVLKDPTAPQERKIAALLNMTEQNMAEIFTQMTVEEAAAEKAQQVIRGYVELMVSKPDTLAMILRLVSHGDYLYYHSIAVAIFSMFIARASGQSIKGCLRSSEWAASCTTSGFDSSSCWKSQPARAYHRAMGRHAKPRQAGP